MLQKQLIILLTLFGISSAAQALTIDVNGLLGTESTGTINGDGTFTCTYDFTASAFCYVTDAQGGNDIAVYSPLLDGETLQYKDNVGGVEEGPLAGSYETVFSNSDSEATITYQGGDKITDAKLVVKDGDAEPARYLFFLAALGWDGMETVELTGFWPDNGAISHVAFFGDVSEVPVPAAVWLFGTALIGFIGFSRRTQV